MGHREGFLVNWSLLLGEGLEEQFPSRTITSSAAKNHLVIEQHVIIRTSYINELIFITHGEQGLDLKVLLQQLSSMFHEPMTEATQENLYAHTWTFPYLCAFAKTIPLDHLFIF